MHYDTPKRILVHNAFMPRVEMLLREYHIVNCEVINQGVCWAIDFYDEESYLIFVLRDVISQAAKEYDSYFWMRPDNQFSIRLSRRMKISNRYDGKKKFVVMEQ